MSACARGRGARLSLSPSHIDVKNSSPRARRDTKRSEKTRLDARARARGMLFCLSLSLVETITASSGYYSLSVSLSLCLSVSLSLSLPLSLSPFLRRHTHAHDLTHGERDMRERSVFTLGWARERWGVRLSARDAVGARARVRAPAHRSACRVRCCAPEGLRRSRARWPRIGLRLWRTKAPKWAPKCALFVYVSVCKLNVRRLRG